MKKYIIFLLCFVAFVSCHSDRKVKTAGKPAITVTILPQKTFVEKIAGNDFDVNVLIPPGANPASYTLLPSQLKEIANSIVWFRIGYIGFELSWKDKITQVNKNMKVYDLSEGLDLIADRTVLRDGKEQPEGVDPHIWMSPQLVKKMAKKICDVLSELNPGAAEKYRAAYAEFIKEIDQLNVEIKQTLQGVEGKTIITFHPSLTYFARDYGLKQVSLESAGKEPTPQHVKEVMDLAKKENIRVMFIQSEFDQAQARVFADETGGKVVQISPLNPDWSQNLLNMAKVIKENIK